MEIKAINVSFSQKINLGNFQSKGIGLSVTAELDESDDLSECRKELSAKINGMLEEEVSKEKKLLLVAGRQ